MSGDQEPYEPFVTTQWTVVLAAGDHASNSNAREALEQLCQTYWYPLYAFARRKGCSPHLSEDLVQGFFAQLLRLDSLKRVSRERGKFRSFLLASFNHFLADEYARSKAQKRGGDVDILSLDAVAAEDRYALEPKDHRTPAELYDRQWAMTLLDETLRDLQEKYRSESKSEFFETCKVMLSGAKISASYAEIGVQCQMTEAAVKMAVSRMRQRYRKLLIQKVGATVESPSMVGGELAYLLQAVGGRETE